jgi:hypothetical protein
MLSNEEELALVDGLQVAPEHGWLKLLYRCKCKKVRTAPRCQFCWAGCSLQGWLQWTVAVLSCTLPSIATLQPDCMPARMMLEL